MAKLRRRRDPLWRQRLSLDPETRALLRELEANRERIERLLDGKEIGDGGRGGEGSEGSDYGARGREPGGRLTGGERK